MTTTGYAPGFSSSAGVKVRPRTALMPSLVYLNSRTGPTQSYPSYKDFRDRTRTLSGLVGYRIAPVDRKSTRLNSSHRCISYAVFCLKKKKKIYLQNQHNI